MPSISVPGALALGAGASLIGGGISALGATSAASTQANALQGASQLAAAEQRINQGALAPYATTAAGGLAGPAMGGLSIGLGGVAGAPGPLITPFTPTMDSLAKTPGYQFTLQQGLQGVANAYGGQGLGNGVTTGGTATTPSGPGVKGALNYAQGLAASTYQQQFQNYLGQNAQIYNMLMGPVQLGEQASAAQAGVGQSASNQITGLMSAGGAASAAGTLGASNALSQGITGFGGGLSNFALINSLGAGGGGFADVASSPGPGVV